MPSERLGRAIVAIDAVNAADPQTVSIDGVDRPKEVVHAELMTRWVTALDPAAGDAQLLAARAHHLRRWSVPRADFPDGRAGYLKWRSTLRRQHAEEVGSILGGVGYDQSTIERVQDIILKRGLQSQPPDPQVQVHEDALCLVFLTTQLDALAEQLGDEHLVEILLKSMRKMSPAGHEAATGLELSTRGRGVLGRAAARL